MVADSTESGESTTAKTMVAIPAWNEEQTIADVIHKVNSVEAVDTVVVVNDGSSDATAAIARSAGATVLTLPFNVGVGGAMRAAFLYAKEHDFDFAVQVDADGQHDPADIPRLIQAAEPASVVIGARFADEDDYEVSFPRRLAMKILASSLSRVTHSTLTDTTSGFRLSDKRAIELFSTRYPAEYLGDTVESLVIAARAGLEVTQVPVKMHERQGGKASQSAVRASLYLGRSILALFVSLSRWRGDKTQTEVTT